MEYVNAALPIDLAGIIEDINIHSRSELVRQIKEHQEQIITKLCGQKYSRQHSFKRAGTYTKKLITAMGTVKFKVQKVRSRTHNTTTSPILECLGVKRYKYSKDLRFKLAE